MDIFICYSFGCNIGNNGTCVGWFWVKCWLATAAAKGVVIFALELIGKICWFWAIYGIGWFGGCIGDGITVDAKGPGVGFICIGNVVGVVGVGFLDAIVCIVGCLIGVLIDCTRIELVLSLL